MWGGRVLRWTEKTLLKFKVPTLRNVALTLPYMHDGRMKVLEDVIDHYTNIDTAAINLDPLLKEKNNFIR